MSYTITNKARAATRSAGLFALRAELAVDLDSSAHNYDAGMGKLREAIGFTKRITDPSVKLAVIDEIEAVAKRLHAAGVVNHEAGLLLALAVEV